jgi:cold shock CspA family protein
MKDPSPMVTGTVSEFDTRGFGLIDSDEGEIVLFHTRSLQEADVTALSVGTRVLYRSREDERGSYADVVRLCEQTH